jgi:hypothetical protein
VKTTFTTRGALCKPRRNMIKKVLPLLMAGFFLTGCSTTVTNLTPGKQYRAPSAVYPLEVAWDSRQKTIKENTLKVFAVIGEQAYQMRPTPMLKNRWEVLVPIAPDKQFIHYRFKFDYFYQTIPEPKPSSKLSAPYQLEIVDPK